MAKNGEWYATIYLYVIDSSSCTRINIHRIIVEVNSKIKIASMFFLLYLHFGFSNNTTIEYRLAYS